jgi:hypothetical protein
MPVNASHSQPPQLEVPLKGDWPVGEAWMRQPCHWIAGFEPA